MFQSVIHGHGAQRRSGGCGRLEVDFARLRIYSVAENGAPGSAGAPFEG